MKNKLIVTAIILALFIAICLLLPPPAVSPEAPGTGGHKAGIAEEVCLSD